MATTKKTASSTTKKAPAKTKTITVTLASPGAIPEDIKLKNGASVSDALGDRSIEGLIVTVNGESASVDRILANGDKLRLGLKTKNQ